MTGSERARTAARWARFALAAFGILPWLLPVVGLVVPHRFTDAFGLVFALVCHRRPERTLTLFDAAMPVCSRCAGVFGGALLGALMAWPRLSLSASRRGLAIALALGVLDVVTQDFGGRGPSHATRLGTGLLFGYLAAVAILSLVTPRHEAPKERTASEKAPTDATPRDSAR